MLIIMKSITKGGYPVQSWPYLQTILDEDFSLSINEFGLIFLHILLVRLSRRLSHHLF